MKRKKSRKFWRLFLFLFVVCIFFQIIRGVWPDQESQARTLLQGLVKKTFPGRMRQTFNAYGIKECSRPDEAVADPVAVILVHGLDEPGMIWRNLIPALTDTHYPVYEFRYPNDQAIELSSAFLVDELMKLDHTLSLTLIAHSMGGLVCRDMLTRPELSFGKLTAGGHVPKVERLIMLGTPQKGAQLVRFRIFLEIRDQFCRRKDPNFHWLNFLMDGTGAAGVDLTPGSSFLRALDRRSLGHTVDTHIIAARLLPFDLPLCDAIGDGLVSLESTRLGNTPRTIVQGTHLTMIRNLRLSDQGFPPAVPVILNILEQGRASSRSSWETDLTIPGA